MSITRLPSGRWRAQVFDPSTGKNRSVGEVLGVPGLTFATKREAKQAREQARARLGEVADASVSLLEFWSRWTSDPLFERPKESTNLHNRERTKAFVDRFGSLLMSGSWDQAVAEWLAGGQRNGQVPALRAMFNDARSAKAGRLLAENPFAGLGLEKTKGNQLKRPPDEEGVQALIAAAHELTPPSFAGYLEFACMSGIRPGELDALLPGRVDLEAGEIHVVEQWNVKAAKFTAPKYGPYVAALTDPAREVFIRMPRAAGAKFVFETLRGTHYTPSSRTHHWNRVRAAVGLGDVSLYLATRHYFGWYALNVLELDAAVIAHQLGHRDGGKLVEMLYGHREQERSRAKVRDAFAGAGKVRHLRAVDERRAS